MQSIFRGADMTASMYTIVVNGCESAKNLAMWGTYGKSGKDPLRWVRLVDCSTDHLQSILKTQRLSSDYFFLIWSILKDRGANIP